MNTEEEPKEDIADRLQREFMESEYAVFYILLKIGIICFCLGLFYLWYT